MSEFIKKPEIPVIKIDMDKINAVMKSSNEAMKDFLNNNPFSEIERIAKDIRDRQDREMALVFTRVIVDMLKSNGVVPKVTEVKTGGTFDKDKHIIKEQYGVYIEGLDFSEHDKVFEDKIAKLEEKYAEKQKDYLSISGLLSTYQSENDSLKKYIAELESKKTEKPTTINLNERIKVKLTPLGADIYYHQHDETIKNYPHMEKYLSKRLPKVDKDGYTELRLHEFISLYGEHIGIAKKNVIEPLDIILCE